MLATKLFLGSMGCLGGRILGWCTGVSPLIVATVQTRCACGATTLKGRGGSSWTPFPRQNPCPLPHTHTLIRAVWCAPCATS